MLENDVIELLNETISLLNKNMDEADSAIKARMAGLLDLVETRPSQAKTRLAAIEGSRTE